MSYIKTGIDSIFAGLMISIGAIIYLNCPNRIVGAFLFSIGLITIMEFGFKLYTGVVGFVRTWDQAARAVLSFGMNAVGCLFILLVPVSNASSAWASRIDTPLVSVFAKAFICGILIFLCVSKKDVVTTMAAIAAFILRGAEHSIADICFMFAAKDVTAKGLLFILVVAIGNAMGSLSVSLWTQYRSKAIQRSKNT
jgi:formate/nitrite transporter FocA (FNT family)